MMNRNRRSFVTTVAAAGTLGLAGCLSQMREWNGDDSPSNQSTSNEETDRTDTDGLPALPGEQIGDFEDLDEWTAMIDAGELEAETNAPYAGSQSGHLTASEGTEFAAVYRTTPDGMDLSGKSLSLAAHFTGRDQLVLTLELFAPNSRNVHELQRTLVGPRDRWVRVDFGTNRIEASPDLTDVRQIRLTVRRRGDTSGSIDCRVDDLRVVDRPETGNVMFLFDGMLNSHYTYAFDRMEAYGFPGVEAVMPEAVGGDGRLTLDRLWELDDAGWDMAARPRTGTRFMHEYTPDEQEGMIKRTKVFLENRGFEDGAKHFVTPRNVLSPTARDLVEEYHELAFRFGGTPNGLPTTDPHNLGFFSGGADEAQTYVDYAAEYGQLAVLQFDYIGENGISERAFDGVLEYVDEQNVEVVTASDLLNS